MVTCSAVYVSLCKNIYFVAFSNEIFNRTSATTSETVSTMQPTCRFTFLNFVIMIKVKKVLMPLQLYIFRVYVLFWVMIVFSKNCVRCLLLLLKLLLKHFSCRGQPIWMKRFPHDNEIWCFRNITIDVFSQRPWLLCQLQHSFIMYSIRVLKGV